MKKIISIISAICIVVAVIPFSAYAASITPEISIEEFSEQLVEMQEDYEDEPLSNRLIVKSERKINKLDSVDIVEGYNDLHIVQFDNSNSAKQALEYYEKSKYVEYAETDMTMTTCETTGITYDNHLSWGSESIGVDDYIDYLGDVSTLPEIVVGIIDTGIDLDHKFLQNRIIPTDFNVSNTGNPASEDDDHGHGTHVAGIVADNTTDNVKIKSYKCLNSAGSGNISDILLGIYSAVEDNVNVINMSLGSPKYNNTRYENSSLENAIKYAIENKITVCVAAGNNSSNATNYTPACVEDCITVGAIDAFDKEPYWSNYGDVVDIVAPGVSIYSSYNDGNFTTLSGTSMATPFVSAASALLLSKNPKYTSTDICNILKFNGRNWTEDTEEMLYGVSALFIGNLTEFTSKERALTPTFSLESGKYSDGIYVEISSNEDAEIYYTLDGNRATIETGTLYTEPIYIDKVTTIHAVAYAPNKLKSLQAFSDYYITHTDDESNFIVDSDGAIIKYIGNNRYLSIPEKINGISVTEIGSNVFSNSDLIMLNLPSTVTKIDDSAFECCDKLESVYGSEIKHVGKYSFYDCESLTDIDLSNLEFVDEYAFAYCSNIISLKNEELTEIHDFAFTGLEKAINFELPSVKKVGKEGLSWAINLASLNITNVEILGSYALSSLAKIESIYLPNLTELDSLGGQFSGCISLKQILLPKCSGTIGPYFFDDCYKLETIYIPKISVIDKQVFQHCNNLKLIFSPELAELYSLPNFNNINIYLSKKLNLCTDKSKNSYNIIAPTGSYAQQWAEDNGHTFIPCDSRDIVNNKDIEEGTNVRAYGRSIRVTNTGLRFGFSWSKIPEIEDLAEKIEYGFIYHYNYDNEPFTSSKLTIDNVGTENIKKKAAVNLDDTEDGKTTFNLVFTNIPDNNQNTNISVRAYVCIDGMYFYSNTLNGSFSEVAKLVLSDDNIDIATKNSVKKLLVQEV